MDTRIKLDCFYMRQKKNTLLRPAVFNPSIIVPVVVVVFTFSIETMVSLEATLVREGIYDCKFQTSRSHGTREATTLFTQLLLFMDPNMQHHNPKKRLPIILFNL